jgi:hypothetical protein
MAVEIDDRVEHAALKSTFAEFGEKALDEIEPTRRGRGEVESEARIAAEPGAHLRVLVGDIFIEDDMHNLSHRRVGLVSVEEADGFLMAMALHAAADDLTPKHLQSGE